MELKFSLNIRVIPLEGLIVVIICTTQSRSFPKCYFVCSPRQSGEVSGRDPFACRDAGSEKVADSRAK